MAAARVTIPIPRETGELSEALRAEIEAAMGKETVDFEGRRGFGDAGGIFLAEKLRGNTTVEKLTLEFCRIGAVGARALAEALGKENNTLEDLEISLNDFRDDGAEAMALMLRKNTSLTELDLAHSGVGERGARALGDALKDNPSKKKSSLKSSTLKSLIFNSSQLGDEGAKALAEALRWNESLEQLDLGICRMTDVGASSLLAALRESNSTLTDLYLSGNSEINNSIKVSILELLEENEAVVPETAERRARCLLFCCLHLAPKAHEHVVPSIGAVPVPVMQYAVEHAGKLHVAKRFEHGNVVAGRSSAGVRARSSTSSDDDLQSRRC